MTLPHLVLLPGLLNDHRLWAAQSAALIERFTLTVGDLTAADTMPGLAEAVLASVPDTRFALVGLSMGGYAALEILRRAPERVAGLALLDTQALPDTPEASANRRKQVAQAAHDFDAVVDALFPRMVSPAHGDDTALKELFRDMALAVGPEAFARQQAAIMSRVDSRPFLKDIACPTLVLCGAEDAVTPPERHREMAEAIPDATLQVIDGAGHLSPIERPEAVTAALEAWLKRVPGFD